EAQFHDLFVSIPTRTQSAIIRGTRSLSSCPLPISPIRVSKATTRIAFPLFPLRRCSKRNAMFDDVIEVDGGSVKLKRKERLQTKMIETIVEIDKSMGKHPIVNSGEEGRERRTKTQEESKEGVGRRSCIDASFNT
ncbi:unnamed protein product, partial [Brassica oleracea]